MKRLGYRYETLHEESRLLRLSMHAPPPHVKVPSLSRMGSLADAATIASVKGLSRGLTPNLSLESLHETYEDSNLSRPSAPVHGKPVFDNRQVHLERVWQSLERDLERAKRAHRRSGALQQSLRIGEPFPINRAREEAHRRRVRSANDAARYAHPGLAADALIMSSPGPMPEPNHLLAMRQQRRNAHEHRMAEEHISFLPTLPEAAELAKRTWAAPAFRQIPPRGSATSLAEEAAAAIESVHSIAGVSQGDALQVVTAWKGPTAEKKAARFLRKRSSQLVLDRSSMFRPYDPREDEDAYLYLPDWDGSPAVREELRPSTSPSHFPFGSRLAPAHAERSPPRGSTSQGQRAKDAL